MLNIPNIVRAILTATTVWLNSCTFDETLCFSFPGTPPWQTFSLLDGCNKNFQIRQTLVGWVQQSWIGGQRNFLGELVASLLDSSNFSAYTRISLLPQIFFIALTFVKKKSALSAWQSGILVESISSFPANQQNIFEREVKNFPLYLHPNRISIYCPMADSSHSFSRCENWFKIFWWIKE